jgi:CheY-like chemotaxis protein
MRSGFEVLLASDGLEAIEVTKRHPGEILLVVLDLSMPGMDGAEVLPELRKIRPGIRVVVSSGYNEAETMRMFKGQEVSGFIQKPYTSNRLAATINSTLA